MAEKLRYWYRAWRYRTRCEPGEIRFILDTVKAGQTCIDIGGHKGAFTYWLSRKVGAAGRVITFEPQHELASYLARITSGYGFDNVEVIELALSTMPESRAMFRETEAPSTGASLLSASTKGIEFTVEVESLDRVLAQRGVERVDFIKCDVEGHELEVFRGGEETLRQFKPTLMFECEKRHRGERPLQEVFDYLESLGYEGQLIYRKKLHPLSVYPIGNITPGHVDYVNNFVFRALPDRRLTSRAA